MIRRNTVHILALTLLTSAMVVPQATAAWDDLLKQGQQLLEGQNRSEQSGAAVPAGMDTATLARGLKEALRVGGERAIGQLAATDGYYGRPDVRIPLPGMLESGAELLRRAGLESYVETFERSMNRAAEQAISEATPVFLDTLEQMTLEDARRIYSGGDSAATEYFRDKTSTRLQQRMQPLISEAMSASGVSLAYEALVQQAESYLPMLQGFSPDLNEHVTSRALEGLFLRLGEEERLIRQQPAARTTELLKQVFGS